MAYPAGNYVLHRQKSLWLREKMFRGVVVNAVPENIG
jgi:hypothetical protein